ncbi:GlxA family transcriptional regulator [Flavitalea flava]
MINITVLVLKRAVLASIADAVHIFQMANEFLRQSGSPALFHISLAGLTQEVDLQDGLFTIHPDTMVGDIQQTDLVIIPSMTGDIFSATYLNKGYISWISTQFKNGAEVASLSVGTFLLAFSGLLNGKQCTTHWMYANEFRTHYPGIRLVDERMFSDYRGLYSSGGSYWNLLLHLVEKFTSRKLAIRVSKYFVIDLDRTNQLSFAVFKGIKDHDDQAIHQAQVYIEQNYREKLTVDQLAARFSISRRTFERRFKKSTSNTVVEYIQRIKIETAKLQLESGRKNVNEVMYDIGYSDTKAFRDVFKKITGITPASYRAKYNKDSPDR